MAEFVARSEVENIFEINSNNKLDLKIDDTGSVTLTKSVNGLKADYTAPEIPVAIKEIALRGTSLVITDTQNTPKVIELPQPEVQVDVKLSGAEITHDNKLKLTLSNGDVLEADLSKFIDAPKTAQEYWNEIKQLPTFKQDLIDVLKGEALQNLAGETFGFLITKD